MDKKHVTIIDSAGCKISGVFTDKEIELFKSKEWKVIEK